MHSLGIPLLLVVSVLTACAGAGAPAGGASPRLALYALDCGHFSFRDTDFYADDGSFKGVSREMANPCYLIRHGGHWLIWDLGMPDGLAKSREKMTPRDGVVLHMPNSLAAQLAMLGISASDIGYVGISHGHFDHIGNARSFGHATFLLDEREHAHMLREDTRASATGAVGIHSHELMDGFRVLDRAKIVKIPHEEPYDVFGDASVVIHPAPGHTPGHRVLLVRLPEAGALLLTGDMFHLAESRARKTVPRRNDRAQTLSSISAVEKLATDANARVIRQHVPEDFGSLPAFPRALY